MTAIRVRCLTCGRVSLVDDEDLGAAKCRACGSPGIRRESPPAFVPRDPTRIGPHEAPPDELDEADDVERRRAWRAAVKATEDDGAGAPGEEAK